MTSTAKYLFPCLLAIFATTNGTVFAQGAPAAPALTPLQIIDVHSQDALKHIRPNFGDPVVTVEDKGILVQLPAARANYAGIQVFPDADPKVTWDFSKYGDIEAKITNKGKDISRFTLSVQGTYAGAPANNGEPAGLKPGESKVVKIIFGYSFGKAGAILDQSKIKQILLYVDKRPFDQAFEIEYLQAGGVKGEKPPFNPADAVIVPPNGVILGPGVAFDVAKQVVASGAKVSAANGSLALGFSGKEQKVTVKPPYGVWNLNQANEIKVTFKNVGQTPASPVLVLGPNRTGAVTPIAPGAEGVMAVSFVPAVSVVESTDWTKGPMPGTGTTLVSTATKSFDIEAGDGGAKSLLVTSIVADTATMDVPDWVGKRPPVAGDWTMTFDDEFNAPDIDLHKWNIYGHNYWDKRTHFSKDDLILKDGKAILHYEKKTGPHNDGVTPPDDKNGVGTTDYATGFLNTFGKFTQRYGYFESRMKLPTAPGLWPAFWLMPDRGKTSGSRYRIGTGKQPEDGNGVGGMEFDIMEFLSGWGPDRFNIAMIWDGYGKDKKNLDCELNYYKPDKDGYVTVGLLWTPGSAVYYINGSEALRWENPRVSDVEEYIMYDMVTGGWSNTPFDDTKLPDDFYIDYVRVWQRKDLATPADGPKKNSGDPSEMKN